VAVIRTNRLRPRPHATDPAQCEFDHWCLVPQIGDQKHTPSPAGGPDLPIEDAPLEVARRLILLRRSVSSRRTESMSTLIMSVVRR
jgi:hypothetical protein